MSIDNPYSVPGFILSLKSAFIDPIFTPELQNSVRPLRTINESQKHIWHERTLLSVTF